MINRFFHGRFGRNPGGEGAGQGRGRGFGRHGIPGAGHGRGRGNKPGSGPGGNCVCPQCGHSVPHLAGQRCIDQICPKCGARMTRE